MAIWGILNDMQSMAMFIYRRICGKKGEDGVLVHFLPFKYRNAALILTDEPKFSDSYEDSSSQIAKVSTRAVSKSVSVTQILDEVIIEVAAGGTSVLENIVVESMGYIEVTDSRTKDRRWPIGVKKMKVEDKLISDVRRSQASVTKVTN